ncbi:uncharacterized protein METZ01_LOCUS427920, partial [marine metagenome]
MNVAKAYLAKIALTTSFILALSSLGMAQDLGMVQDLKVGVVNVQQLMQQAPQARVVMETLEEEFSPRDREISAKATEFQELQERVQRDLAVMGETERRNA